MRKTNFNDIIRWPIGQDHAMRLRILPPMTGGLFQTIRLHYIYPEYKVFICGKQRIGGRWWTGKCVLCEKYEGNYQALKQIKPVERYYYNVVVHGESTAKVFPCGLKIHTEIKLANMGDDMGDVTDPVSGRDMLVRRYMMPATANVRYYDYSVEWFQPSPLAAWDKIVFEELHDLEQFWKPKSPKEMLAAFDEVFGKLRVYKPVVFRSIDEDWQA